MPNHDDVTHIRVRTLEQIVSRGQVWSRMADKYGVANPVPPWRSSLDGMCDALDRQATVLPLLTRRSEEDRLSTEVYATLPFPENQLVALAHSLIARNVIDEAALATRMEAVRARLERGEG
ncbi:thiocyanate hydrolase [Nocardia sp. NPDC004711]